jgi:hypothetical protein
MSSLQLCSARRQEVEASQANGELERAEPTLPYDDDESVLHGTDDIEALLATAEADLFERLRRFETGSSAADLLSLATTASDLAVLPSTPPVRLLIASCFTWAQVWKKEKNRRRDYATI